MPVDYSKWDALELSDDSDIEVHPNVDKRSFIRAKQAQIHMERDRRKQRIATLEYEDVINQGLLSRIDRLLTALKSHKTEVKEDQSNVDELILTSMVEVVGSLSNDKPDAPPPGVHSNEEPVTYSKMMGSLVDQVQKEVKAKNPTHKYEAFIDEVQAHKSKVEGLQIELHKDLKRLEKEESKHITSENIQDGFNYSNVNRAPAPSKTPSKATAPELLNPSALSESAQYPSSGAEGDVEEGSILDPEHTEPSEWGRKFAEIPLDDYRSSLRLISEHPNILTEKESDALLIMAFDKQLEGKEVYAKQCVHQALLIQYCRQLGKDGVNLFFKRVTTKDHQARKLFFDDVGSTYAKIKERVRVYQREKAEEGEGVEQIQLHAVDPNTTINIRVPPPVPTDLAANSTEPPPTEDQLLGRRIFETFPPGLQRALESNSLDEINKVLGKMSVDEAEDVVNKLGEGGMLSIEEGVIDATTEEGQRVMEEIERSGQMPGQGELVEELSEEPPQA